MYMALKRREIIDYEDFTKKNDLFKFHKNIFENKKFKIYKNFDIDKIWTSKNVQMHEKWLKLISKYEDFNECYDNSKDKLNENSKINKKWFERYHNLFYSIKKEGYKVELVKSKSEYPSCLAFPDNTFYRLDGTHRCSVMKYLGFYIQQIALKLSQKKIRLYKKNKYLDHLKSRKLATNPMHRAKIIAYNQSVFLTVSVL